MSLYKVQCAKLNYFTKSKLLCIQISSRWILKIIQLGIYIKFIIKNK